MKSRLDNLFKNPSLTIKKDRPILFLSDLHIGGGGPADNFVPNEAIFLNSIQPYIKDGYLIIITGDGRELWQFTKKEVVSAHAILMALFSMLKDEGRLIELEGNHDKEMKFPESLVIDGKAPILVIHGHQGDLLNDQWWKIGRWFTRYVWKPLEMIGIKDFTSASKNLKKHDLVRKMHNDWANKNEVTLIYGHTHAQESCGYAWNIGCGVEAGKIDVIEYDGIFKEKIWT